MGKKLNTKSFIERAKIIHNNKFDYSKTNYANAHDKVEIICPIHGCFWQKAYVHLGGSDCPKCADITRNIKNEKRKITIEDFLNRAAKIHNNKYNYSKVKFSTIKDKITINCPKHGEFSQVLYNHLVGQGCPKCKVDKIKEKQTKHVDAFISDATKIHNNKYDYSKVEYKGNKKYVTIICPKHGEFKQKPNCHLMGEGCPKCNSSKLEEEIRLFLKDNKINFEEQKTFDWLVSEGHMFLDFYLPKYNIAIECQGKQHFVENKFFGGKIGFEKRVELDNIKKQLCEEHGVRLLYYSNLGIEYPYEVIEDKETLMEAITKNY